MIRFLSQVLFTKKMANLLMLQCILLSILMNFASAGRIKDMIYMPLDNVAACFRRHNGTHQFGCSSSKSGSIGVIHFVEMEDDVRWLEYNATAGPYTVVISFNMFQNDTLIRLRNTNNIHGVLLANNITQGRPNLYSPEDTCPNRYSGYKQCDAPWNPSGLSLLLEDWPFPMFYTQNDTLILAIKNCFLKHNAHDLDKQNERSLCALEMKSFMFAALNSESCIRRSKSRLNLNIYFNQVHFCDPLGDRNIHWPLSPLKKNDKNSAIMIMTRLDASSLFDGISPGAESAITGLVTLLATAHQLNSMNATAKNTNIVFSILNGEAFDYIGSSRLVYDLKNGDFMALGGVQLKLEEIHTLIEISQLSEAPIFLHTKNADQLDITKKLKDSLSATIFKDSTPPSSIQSFLKEKSNFPSIVIADHKETFHNVYYHSILDDLKNIHTDGQTLVKNLAKVASNLAQILYQSATGDTPPKIDQRKIEDNVLDMLSCYLESANCNLFRAASYPETRIVNATFPLYVGVHRAPNEITILTGRLLSLLTSKELPEMNEVTCHKEHLSWIDGYNFTGLCINSTVNYSYAVSPAFVIEGYDMKSNMYSTWTESTWEMLSMRMFLKPSPAVEHFSIILGSVVASLSFILVWFINSRADIIFNSRPVDC